MTNYNNIPMEIWANVFKFIEKPIHLLECRLVCKKWNQPAETAMFSKDLRIYQSKNIRKLCNHLTKSPSRAHLVRSLGVYPSSAENDPENDMVNLIKVVFNPNLKNWESGTYRVDSKAISTVLEIIEGMPESTIYQLREIPLSTIENDENYAKLAYKMRNNLMSLTISATRRPMNTYLEKLAVFRFLTKLKLDAEDLESIAKLESILKNCSHLVQLDLVSPTNNYVEQDRDTLANWMRNNVSKVQSMTNLTIDTNHPDLIEYLAYKYPKMECIYFGRFSYPYQHNQASRLFAASKNIHHLLIMYTFDRHQKFLDLIQMIFGMHEQGDDIDANISYDYEVPFDFGLWLKLDIYGRSISFNANLAHILSVRVHADILDQIHALNGNHKLLRLSIGMLSTEPLPDDEALTLFQIMTKFPSLTNLTYEWKQIKFEPMDTKTDLIKLQIHYAEIDAKVFPQISKSCPQFRFLELVCCSIVNDENQPDKVFNIDLPNTSLCDLYVDIHPKRIYYGTYKNLHIDSMETQNTITGNCYLKLSVLEGDFHFYYRWSSTESPVILCQSEFEARPRRPEDATFLVTCALIVSLIFHISKIKFVINLKEDLFKHIMNDLEKIRLQMLELTLGEVKNSTELDEESIEPVVDDFIKNEIALTTLAGKLKTLEIEGMLYFN